MCCVCGGFPPTSLCTLSLRPLRSLLFLPLLFLFYLPLYQSFPLAIAPTKTPSYLNNADQRKIETDMKRLHLEHMNLNVTENSGCEIGNNSVSISKRNIDTTSTTTPAAEDGGGVFVGSSSDHGTQETEDVDEARIRDEAANDGSQRKKRKSGWFEDGEETLAKMMKVRLEYDNILPFVIALVHTLQFRVVHIYTNKDTPVESIARLLLLLSQDGISVYVHPKNFSLTSNSCLELSRSKRYLPGSETVKTLHLAEVDQFPLNVVTCASVCEPWLLLVIDQRKAEALLKQLTNSVKMLIDNQVIFINTPKATEVLAQSFHRHRKSEESEWEGMASIDYFIEPRNLKIDLEDPPNGEKKEHESDGLAAYKDHYTVYEMYNPSPDLPHRYLQLGSWRFEGGTVHKEFNDLENPLRRRDLTGLHLRCVTADNHLPYVTMDRIGKEVKLRGWFADIYASMQEYFNFTYQMLIKRPGMADSKWTAYILVFSDGVWLSLLISLALSLIVLLASVSYSPFEKKTRISDIIMIPIYAVSQQGWFSDVTAHSCRIAYLTLYLTTTLFYAAYTSTLTSALATQRMTLPFEDMAGALRLGSYRLGFTKGYSAETPFRYATGGIYKEVWEKLIKSDPDNLVPNDEAGAKRVLTTKNYAFLTYDLYNRLENMVPQPCNYVILPKNYFSVPIAMALTSGSPYKKIFDAYILKLKDSGLIEKYRRNHVSQKSNCEESGTQPLGIQNVFSGFMFVPFGIALASVFLLCEFMNRYMQLARVTDIRSTSMPTKRSVHKEQSRITPGLT